MHPAIPPPTSNVFGRWPYRQQRQDQCRKTAFGRRLQLVSSQDNNNGFQETDEQLASVSKDSGTTANTRMGNKNLQTEQQNLAENLIEDSKKQAAVFNVVSTLWSGFIFLFGATLTCGLILNLLGYGYSIYPPRIEPLDQLRMEQQLLQPASGVDGGGGGPSEFFLHNPFTTTLILTGAVLAYESLLGVFQDGDNNKKNEK
ncbi:hypothetical protein ACA910_008047 [Epithemia clementina (nom. ined.)]